MTTPSLGWLNATPQPHLLTARLKRQGTAELLTNDADVNPEITPFAESDMMLKVGSSPTPCLMRPNVVAALLIDSSHLPVVGGESGAGGIGVLTVGLCAWNVRWLNRVKRVNPLEEVPSQGPLHDPSISI